MVGLIGCFSLTNFVVLLIAFSANISFNLPEALVLETARLLKLIHDIIPSNIILVAVTVLVAFLVKVKTRR